MVSVADFFKEDIIKAVEILQAQGCFEVYVFGSVADSTSTNFSDLDIAVRGLVPEKFFATLGKLISTLDHDCDLIDLDDLKDPFAKMLAEGGELVRVA